MSNTPSVLLEPLTAYPTQAPVFTPPFYSLEQCIKTQKFPLEK